MSGATFELESQRYAKSLHSSPVARRMYLDIDPPEPQIDKHTLHYLSTDPLRSRLSDIEIAYATRHQALLHNHYLSSFLGSFPQPLQNLNDTAGNISMIDAPDLEAAVFIRLLRDTTVESKGVDADGSLDAKDGSILILRWSDAKPLVQKGAAELV